MSEASEVVREFRGGKEMRSRCPEDYLDCLVPSDLTSWMGDFWKGDSAAFNSIDSLDTVLTIGAV